MVLMRRALATPQLTSKTFSEGRAGEVFSSRVTLKEKMQGEESSCLAYMSNKLTYFLTVM